MCVHKITRDINFRTVRIIETVLMDPILYNLADVLSTLPGIVRSKCSFFSRSFSVEASF